MEEIVEYMLHAGWTEDSNGPCSPNGELRFTSWIEAVKYCVYLTTAQNEAATLRLTDATAKW
jgi:hypothetical protein